MDVGTDGGAPMRAFGVSDLCGGGDVPIGSVGCRRVVSVFILIPRPFGRVGGNHERPEHPCDFVHVGRGGNRPSDVRGWPFRSMTIEGSAFRCAGGVGPLEVWVFPKNRVVAERCLVKKAIGKPAIPQKVSCPGTERRSEGVNSLREVAQTQRGALIAVGGPSIAVDRTGVV